jgi:hypothetical protein
LFISMFRFISFSLLFLAAAPVMSSGSDSVYPLRRQGLIISDAELTERKLQYGFDLTFSGDGETLTLPQITLQLFTTSGFISQGARTAIETAANAFFEAEMNNRLDFENEIAAVNTAIVANGSVRVQADSLGGRLRSLQETVTGSELDLEISVDMKNSPSPLMEELEKVLEESLSDLTYLLANITAQGHVELEGADKAVHTSPPTEGPTAAPVKDDGPKISQINNVQLNTSPGDDRLGTLWPALVVMAGVFMLTACFIGLRRQRISAADLDISHDSYDKSSQQQREPSPLQVPVDPDYPLTMRDGTQINLPKTAPPPHYAIPGGISPHYNTAPMVLEEASDMGSSTGYGGNDERDVDIERMYPSKSLLDDASATTTGTGTTGNNVRYCGLGGIGGGGQQQQQVREDPRSIDTEQAQFYGDMWANQTTGEI